MKSTDLEAFLYELGEPFGYEKNCFKDKFKDQFMCYLTLDIPLVEDKNK